MPESALDYRDLIPDDSAVIDEIVRQAEERLKMQVQMAIAADARAMLLASLQGAGAVALIVASADHFKGLALVAITVAAAMLIGCAVCATIAAMPIAFCTIGTYPGDWIETVRNREPLKESKAGYACYLDEFLRTNEKQMTMNNNWFRASLVGLLLTPVFAGAASLIFNQMGLR